MKVSELFFAEADGLKDLEHGEFEPEEIAKGWGDWAVKQYAQHKMLPGPDVHTPSWLRLSELQTALEDAGLKLADQSPEFSAVIESMRVLSEAYGNENVRLVFWFDG